MISRKITIYQPSERKPKVNQLILVYLEGGSVEICYGSIFDVCPNGITHWSEVPVVETPFERERKRIVLTSPSGTPVLDGDGIERRKFDQMACCEQAVMNDCVCFFSCKCPVHGTKHVGTHD